MDVVTPAVNQASGYLDVGFAAFGMVLIVAGLTGGKVKIPILETEPIKKREWRIASFVFGVLVLIALGVMQYLR